MTNTEPYLINIRKYSADEAFYIMRDWLDRSGSLRRLEFNPNYMIKYNINTAEVKDRKFILV